MNNPENTTTVITKELRDSLMSIKYKYKMEDLNQVIQLLYNTRDEKQVHSVLKLRERKKEDAGLVNGASILTPKEKQQLQVGVNSKYELGEI